MNSKMSNHVKVENAVNIEKCFIFVLFFVAFASGLYQIFLIKQLSITSFLNSQTITINVIISLTLASLGLGAYLAKFIRKVKVSTLLAILIAPLIIVNIIILKFNFGPLSITKIPALINLILIFSSPVIIIGAIFAKIYLSCIRSEICEKQYFKNFWIGVIVLVHTMGFILGTLASILFIKMLSANILLMICFLLAVILIIYIKVAKRIKRHSLKNSPSGLTKHRSLLKLSVLFVIIISVSILSLAYLYNRYSLDRKIESQRNARYILWSMRYGYDEDSYKGYEIINKNAPRGYLHLYSGWSPYSKIDIFSWEKECIGGAYNYKQQWMACPDVDSDFDVRKLLYSKIQGRVLLVGTGGGMGCFQLDSYQNSDTTCIEIDPLVVHLMKTRFQRFNGNIYNTIDVRTIDGRFFLDNTDEKFDYIIYEGTDLSVSTKIKSLIGIENYLYTYEGIKRAVDSLTTGGVLMMLHGRIGFPFEKLKKTIRLCGFKEDDYLYYDFTIRTPVIFPGKVLLLSKDKQKISMFKEIMEKNNNFKKTAFRLEENYRLITDDNPFIYLRNNSQIYPFLFCAAILSFLSFLILLSKKMRVNYFYFLTLGISFILIELFIITVLRAFFFDYITTYAITNSIIMISLSLGSLFYDKFKKIYICFPLIAMISFVMIYNINYSWSFIVKLLYLSSSLSPLFLMLGSYFPVALNNITKREFPLMYLLDSMGSSIGFFIFYSTAMLAGIKYNFMLAAALYTFLSLIAIKKFK